MRAAGWMPAGWSWDPYEYSGETWERAGRGGGGVVCVRAVRGPSSLKVRVIAECAYRSDIDVSVWAVQDPEAVRAAAEAAEAAVLDIAAKFPVSS